MKTLTNLEFKKNGAKNNAIVSRETLGESKQIKSLQEENGVFKYETQDGVKEIKVEKPTNTDYKILSSDWVATGQTPFKFKQTLELPRVVGDNDEVRVDINNELEKTIKYQIGFMNLTANNIDVVAMKQPLEDLNISLVIEKTDFLDRYLPTKALVYTLSDTSDYYIIGNGGANGNGLNINWKGGEVNILSTYNGLPVKEISVNAFGGVDNITKCYIGEGVTDIDTDAFKECANLSSIILPKSLKVLDVWCMRFCVNLTFIVYNGTKEQWRNVMKFDAWNLEVPAQVVHCTDGDAPIGGV